MTDRPNFSAMTVNERLFVARTLDEFDAAAAAGDRARAVELLLAVDLGPQAETIADQAIIRATRRTT